MLPTMTFTVAAPMDYLYAEESGAWQLTHHRRPTRQVIGIEIAAPDPFGRFRIVWPPGDGRSRRHRYEFWDPGSGSRWRRSDPAAARQQAVDTVGGTRARVYATDS